MLARFEITELIKLNNNNESFTYKLKYLFVIVLQKHNNFPATAFRRFFIIHALQWLILYQS